MSYKFTRVGIYYPNRMFSGCKMSYVNLQGFGDVEASEGSHHGS